MPDDGGATHALGNFDTVHHNPHFSVIRSTICRTGKEPAEYWSVEKPSFAAVVAFDRDGAILLVYTFRTLIGRAVWEIPQGAVDLGESTLQCARRELFEEAGAVSDDWQELATIYESYGLTRSICNVFEARATVISSPHFDEGEGIIGAEFVQRADVLRRIADGDIVDAISLAVLGVRAMLISDDVDCKFSTGGWPS